MAKLITKREITIVNIYDFFSLVVDVTVVYFDEIFANNKDNSHTKNFKEF